MQLNAKGTDLRIRPFGYIPYKQGCECTPFSGSIDTLLKTNEKIR